MKAVLHAALAMLALVGPASAGTVDGLDVDINRIFSAIGGLPTVFAAGCAPFRPSSCAYTFDVDGATTKFFIMDANGGLQMAARVDPSSNALGVLFIASAAIGDFKDALRGREVVLTLRHFFDEQHLAEVVGDGGTYRLEWRGAEVWFVALVRK